MSASHNRDDAPNFDAILSMSSAQLYKLVGSADSSDIESLIARLFREFFLECPDRSKALLDRLTEITNDPVLRSMALAPDDDEPLTDDDIIAIDEAIEDFEGDELTPRERLA